MTPTTATTTRSLAHPRWHQTQGGEWVVIGLESDIQTGTIVTVRRKNGETQDVYIIGCSKTFVGDDGKHYRYGYTSVRRNNETINAATAKQVRFLSTLADRADVPTARAIREKIASGLGFEEASALIESHLKAEKKHRWALEDEVNT